MENLRQKLKIFNYRPLVLVFLGLIGGVLVANFIKVETLTVIIGIAISFLVLIFYSILHKKLKYLIIFLITFALGFGSFSIYMQSRIQTNLPNMENQIVTGVVENIKNRGGYLELLVTDVRIHIDENDEKGTKLSYNVNIDYYNTYQEGYIKLQKGSKITCIISNQDYVGYYTDDFLPHTENLSNNVGVWFETYYLLEDGKEDSLRLNALERLRENLRYGLNNKNGEMIYSAMFGDKTALSHDLYDSYKSSGVAHLLAVSGLHVGLVVGILYWILDKLKIKGWARVIIVAILLFVYAYLCNFSYSIIRASIMALVLLIAPLFFSEYDILSSICFAGSLILIIEPIALFDLSAILSFGCVLGIAMIYPIFKRWMKRVPIKEKIKDGFCISLSTILSTLIPMAYFFGGFQPIGLLSNIIIIPVFSILFTVSFVISMISLILPFVCFALNLVNPLFEILNWSIIFIANSFKGWSLPSVSFLSIILAFAVMAFASKYNIKKGLDKISIAGICLCVLMLQMVWV